MRGNPIVLFPADRIPGGWFAVVVLQRWSLKFHGGGTKGACFIKNAVEVK